MKLSLAKAFPAATGLLVISMVGGCAVTDRRLADDQASCRAMGHVPGTANFGHCLVDLNDRRCAVAHPRGGQPEHVASEDCTRLRSAGG